MGMLSEAEPCNFPLLISHLTDVIMFKQGQQAHVTLAFDSLEKSHVSVA